MVVYSFECDHFKVVRTRPTDLVGSRRDAFDFEMDTYGVLYDATGNVIVENDDFNDRDFALGVLGLPAGTYYLKVDAYYGKPGSYFLGVVIGRASSGAGKPTVSSDHLKRKARELLKDGSNPMNQQQFDLFKAELRRIIETRIERPLNQINTKLTLVEAKLKEHDQRLERIEAKLYKIDTKLTQHDE